MFIYLSKKETASFNREISEMIGGMSLSGVTHQYKRTLKRLKEDRRFLKQWERESKAGLTPLILEYSDSLCVRYIGLKRT